MTKGIQFNKLIEGDIATLAQSITLIESSLKSDEKKANSLIKKCLKVKKQSFRICISGAPGAGKSTFINEILNHFIKNDKKIAVLAIDPSSEKSKGSILGDKTRMSNFSNNQNIFIRPSPSKGELGGVAKKTRESIILCEKAGFEIVIIETTGVGQTEITAKKMTDFFILLTIPNSGDYLQAIKKGVIEVADLIIINKIDIISNTDIEKEKNYYSQIKNNYKKIHTCSATKNIGINNIFKVLYDNYLFQVQNGKLHTNRQNQVEYWINKSIKENLIKKIYSQKNIHKEIKKAIEKIQENNESIEELSIGIIEKYLK